MPPNLLLPLSVYGRGNYVGCLCNLAPRALKRCAHETFRGFSDEVQESLYRAIRELRIAGRGMNADALPGLIKRDEP